MTRSVLPPTLAALVESQAGVMTRAQAVEHGMTRAQIDWLPNIGWQRLAWGVYSQHEAAWLQQAWAGALIGGPSAAIGGRAAARLHGFHDRGVGIIDIWIPPHVRVLRPEPGDAGTGWRFRRGRRAVHQGSAPPRITATEAILDLSATATSEDLSGWVSRALNRKVTTTARLRSAMAARQRLPGRALLARMLDAADMGLESPLELAYFRDVERAHGLPAGVRQSSMSWGTRTDVLYGDWKLLVELDGVQGHRGEGEVRDARRDAEHLALGLATLRFGWPQVTHEPCASARLVARVLANRGWPGSAQFCGRCDPHTGGF